MPLNPCHPGYAVLLVGLCLLTSGVSCASPTSSAPGSLQPALLASPPISTVLLAARTPDVLDPAPHAAGTALYLEAYSPVKKALDDAQPQDRTPTRLVIPAIGLDAPVEPVGWHVETQNGRPANVLWDVPNHFAAGWLKSSAPLGVSGNTVLDGHHNINGEVFKNLINVQVGDIITLCAASQERVYRVDQKLILEEAGQPLAVRQANARYVNPTADERLTLVTCWPPTGNSHRLIIVARPVSLSPR
jgi:LPXTG-site transpeptidase (sortase) family protein